MLSNIVFIIILILLIIILVLLYFFSNDIRKNKNKLNIIESDINALRERLQNINQKVTSIEGDLNNESKKKFNGSQNYGDIFEKLGSINNDFFPLTHKLSEQDYEDDDGDHYNPNTYYKNDKKTIKTLINYLQTKL